MVELGLVLPLLIILVGAAFDWSLTFFASYVTHNSAREATRYAVTRFDPGPADSCVFPSDCLLKPDGTVLKEAAKRIPNVSLFSGFDIAYGGIDGSCEISVTVSGNYDFIFLGLINSFIGSFPKDITIVRTSAMKSEWPCS